MANDHFVPDFDNPYPEAYDGEKIEDFRYLTPLILRREVDAVRMRGGKDDADYIVGAEYKVSYKFKGEGKARTIAVPRGLLTDLASVPQELQSFVSKVGPHLEASIVHDFLYVAWQDIEENGEKRGAREADWNFADAIMEAAMVAAEVTRTQRRRIMFAVRLVGWSVYRKENKPPRYHKFW